MRTWLLLTLDESERSYKGNLGYSDDIRRVYRYDSFVPNHLQVSRGDVAIIRGKRQVYGSAVIEQVEVHNGQKIHNLCPSCGTTNIRERHTKKPRYRCECGAEFEVPVSNTVPCNLYDAHFGDSFLDTAVKVEIQHLWVIALRLNKQLAILELDTESARALLLDTARQSSHPDQIPRAAIQAFIDVQLSSFTMVADVATKQANSRAD